jgi:ketol-acid reductoisomerase
VLEGKTIGVMGYGNQGRAQALNLRDSHFRVVVGCPPDAYRDRAVEDGLDAFDVSEATQKADIILILIPDEVQPAVYRESIAPGLEKGKALGFASGYNIYFNLIEPPSFVDLFMVAPRMIGSAVRSRYLSGRGFPCLVAVGEDATGRAHKTTLAIARAIGGTKAGAFASSFKEEVLVDLFAEQFLWAGIGKLCRLYFETLVAAGCTPETVATEMYLSGEMLEVAKAMIEEGFFKQLDLHSQTSQYGQLSRADRVLGDGAEERARQVLEAIRNGDFAREWAKEQAQGKPTLSRLKREALEHPLNEIERKLSWSAQDE